MVWSYAYLSPTPSAPPSTELAEAGGSLQLLILSSRFRKDPAHPPTPIQKRGRIERTGYPALVSKCTPSPQEQTPPQTPKYVLPWPAPQLVYITQLQQRDAKLRAKYKFMFLLFSFLFYFWVFFILFYFETGFHYVALTVLELLLLSTLTLNLEQSSCLWLSRAGITVGPHHNRHKLYNLLHFQHAFKDTSSMSQSHDRNGYQAKAICPLILSHK